MKENIVIVGGYGHVGKKISTQLGKLYPGKVIAAGRNYLRAESFCKTTKGAVVPLELDIRKSVPNHFFDQVKLVVMCLDQSDVSFARSCLEHNVHYVDISANYEFLSQVEKLQAEAKHYQAAAVLSVGLSPGLTNLLAAHAKKQLERTGAIDIYIMLGLGDVHGKAALEWTVANMNKCYEVVSNGEKIVVDSFRDGKKTSFGHLGRRTGFRFNFSDQHVLAHTLNVPSVSTRLCFDSRGITWMIALLKKIKFFNLLKYQTFHNSIVSLLSNIRWGKEICAVKIDAWGELNGKKVMAEYFFHEKHESAITAKIAAKVAKEIYQSKQLQGVYHLEQLFDIDLFRDVIVMPEMKLREFRCRKLQ